MLGADHHGYVGRLMAMCAAFGDEPGTNLEILIGQMVNLLSDGQPLRMSKRAGTVITLDDLVDAVGVDAARYALARYTSDTSIDIDLDLWARQTSDNPVFYVQYAHARPPRSCATPLTSGSRLPWARASTLRSSPTRRRATCCGRWRSSPRVVASAAQLREPHRVARYLEDTAAAYHRFYDACRVLPMGDEEPGPVHGARLLLVDATRVVVANGLGLLGVSAPERM